jgi:hypothetical protein
VQFAQARRRLFPDCGAEWMECAGAYAVFDGIGSPATQTFGLGIFEDLTAASLDVIERFFRDRGAQVLHEVSPHAGVAALGLLCARQYKPAEISNVMVRPVEKPMAKDRGTIAVRVTGPDEAQLWNDISPGAGATNTRNSGILSCRPAPSLQRASRVRAFSPSSTANPAPPERSASMRVSRCLPVRPPFQNCAVVGCKRPCSRSVCATPSTRAATWR